jgi:hypothetical protein
MRRNPVGTDGKAVGQPAHLTRHQGQIIWQDLARENVGSVISREVTIARATDQELEWKLYSHDAPKGLADALVGAGFERQPTETIMIRRADLGQAPSVEGLEIAKVQTLADATAAFELLHTVFGNSRHANPEALLQEARSTQSFYLGRYHDIAVSCGRLEIIPGCAFAGLYGGVTHEEFRRRGFYRPIVYARCAEAEAAGCDYVFSEALSTSRPVLEALGFEALCSVTGFVLRSKV